MTTAKPRTGKLFWRIMILTAVVGILIGCDSFLPEILPAELDTSLISPQSCLPPCWYGIVPGQTDVDSARSILQSLSFVNANSLTSDSRDLLPGYEPSLRWRYRGATLERHDGVLDIRDKVVMSNIVNLPGCLSFDDVVAYRGLPYLVRAEGDPETPNAWFEFFYPNSGIMLYGRFPGHGEKEAVISPETCIIRADYFPSGKLEDFLVNTRHFIADKTVLAEKAAEYHEWPGMNESIPLAW